MFLRRKIPSSSIAEVVIALAIIALCFGIASLVFIRSNKTTSKFMDIKKQTEFQSLVLEKLYEDKLDEIDWENTEFELEVSPDEFNDSLQIVRLYGDDHRLIWEQQVLKGKRR